MNPALRAMQEENWLDYAASFPLAFAQVREDALIDQWITYQLPHNAQGIMIASGGCTAALLTSGGTFGHLTLVDMNPAQLALARLKLAWLQDYGTEERLSLLGYVPQIGKPFVSLSEEMLRYQIPANLFGTADTVSTLGLDYAGRYELLFLRLQHVIADSDTTETMLRLSNPAEQAAFLDEHPAYVERLRQAFVHVMALPNLVRLFGEEATQNAVMPFAEHFYQRTIHAIKTLPAASNPYLAQMLLGRFPEKAMYPWLELPKQSIHTRITYKYMPMVQALEESEECFDFIHLSNILDWLGREQAKTLLKAAANKLKKGGWLIIRQLNSNLPVPELCPSLVWHPDTAATLHAKDRSFFYQHLHIARNE